MPDTAALLRAMLDMSPGDRSMLEVASSDKHTDQIHLTTSVGSPNCRLWMQMVEQGWMVRLPDPTEGIPPSVAAAAFELTDVGKSAMPKFLADFAKYHADHVEKMTNIFNGLCLSFTKEFREQVMKSGAAEKDFVLLTASLVARLVADAFAPQSRNNIVELILDQAKKRMADIPSRKAD